MSLNLSTVRRLYLCVGSVYTMGQTWSNQASNGSRSVSTPSFRRRGATWYPVSPPARYSKGKTLASPMTRWDVNNGCLLHPWAGHRRGLHCGWPPEDPGLILSHQNGARLRSDHRQLWFRRFSSPTGFARKHLDCTPHPSTLTRTYMRTQFISHTWPREITSVSFSTVFERAVSRLFGGHLQAFQW